MYKQRSMPVVHAGERFGRLTVINTFYRQSGSQKRTHVHCQCDCGNICSPLLRDVKKGLVVGCGCTSKKHSLTRTRFYRIWADMKTRCNSDDPRFAHYKEVGVCDRWKEASCFVEDMHQSYLDHAAIHGERNTTLDRIDNYKGYSKDNCRWATFKKQQQNRTNNRLITYKDKTASVAEMSDEFGIKQGTLINRLRIGWTVEEAIEIPIGVSRKLWKLN